MHSGEFSSRPRGRNRAECNFPAESRFRSIRLAAHAKWKYEMFSLQCDNEYGRNWIKFKFIFFRGKRADRRKWERSVMKKSISTFLASFRAQLKPKVFRLFARLQSVWPAPCRFHQFANNHADKPNKFGRKQNPILRYTILRWPNTPHHATTLGALFPMKSSRKAFDLFWFSPSLAQYYSNARNGIDSVWWNLGWQSIELPFEPHGCVLCI